jgi:hypothetical protein
MSGHVWNGTAWEKVKAMHMRNAANTAWEEIKVAYRWTGSGFELLYIKAVSFSDTFPYADGSLPSPWLSLGAKLPLIGSPSQSVRAGDPGTTSGVFNGYAIYGTSVNTDDMYCQASFAEIQTDDVCYSGVVVRSDSTATNLVYGDFNNAGWHIGTKVGSTYTTRASGSTSAPASGQVIKLTAVGNVYTLTKAGVLMGTWTDTGGVVTPGSGRRRTGLTVMSERAFFTNNYSANLDNYAAGDQL